MFDSFYTLLYNIYFDLKEHGKDEWCIINCDVARKQLNYLYKKLLTEGCAPIEELGHEKKTKLAEISKKYFQATTDIIMGAKAAYTLSLITSDEI